MKILITGASSDVTKALTKELISHENTVYITCSSKESLEKNTSFWKEEIQKQQIQLLEFSLETPQAAKEELIKINPDAIVLNAWKKVDELKLFHNFSFDEIQKELLINVKGNSELLSYLLPGMIEKQFGRILFVSTMTTILGTSQYAPYSMAKAAIEALIKNLAVDYGKYNITANTIRPGVLKTERTKRFWSREFFRKKMTQSIPLLKLGEPIHVAKACLAFIDAETYLTGAELNVSGGVPLINTNVIAKNKEKDNE